MIFLAQPKDQILPYPKYNHALTIFKNSQEIHSIWEKKCLFQNKRLNLAPI